MSELSPIHLAILKVLASYPPGTWMSTREIGNDLPIREWKEADAAVKRGGVGNVSVFISNQLGSLCGVLVRWGYLLKRPYQRPKGLPKNWPAMRHQSGWASEWCLGPLSDKLKEEGVLE